jgi:hypothetical protein
MRAPEVEKVPRERIDKQQNTAVVMLIRPRLRACLDARADGSQRQLKRGDAVERDALSTQRSPDLANEVQQQHRASIERVGRLDA